MGENKRISPDLEKCCLRASANVSSENAARDLLHYTGISISARTQQRIVQRYEFADDNCLEKVKEISVDGGKVRLRTAEKGQPCIWKDYKSVCIHEGQKKAWFLENEALINWVNHQKFTDPVTCLGDGHPGRKESGSTISMPWGEARNT